MDVEEPDMIAFQRDMEEIYPTFNRWLTNRREAKRQLLLLADELNKHKRNVNVVQVTGSSACVVGTGLAIGGFIASFFTFGASLFVTAVGAGIGGAGGLSNAGAFIALYVLNQKIFRRAQEAIDRDHAITQELREAFNGLNQNALQIIRDHQELEMPLKDRLLLGNSTCQISWIVGKKFIYDFCKMAQLIRVGAVTADVAVDSASTAFRAMGAARVVNIVGFAFGLALLPIDVYNIVKSSMSLHKGNTSAAEMRIRDIVDEMIVPE